MPTPHPRPWHRHSIFGTGPRVTLDREQRAQFRAKLRLQRRPGRLTIASAQIGLILVDMLGNDGRLDPTHATLAAKAAVHVETVRRAIDMLRQCGFLDWTRRLIRIGPCVRQTSNAYQLIVPTISSFFLKPASPTECGSARTAVAQAVLRAAAVGPDLLAARREVMRRRLMEAATG